MPASTHLAVMNSRKPIPDDTQHRVLDRSLRRCALCIHFDNDWGQKEGQLAHLDQDPSNCGEDNLAYLCLPHHDDYDTKRRQTKNLTAREAKTARDRLYQFIENGGDLATAGAQPRGRAADQHTLADIQVLMAKVPTWFLRGPNFAGCSFSTHDIENFRVVVQHRAEPQHEFIDAELEELRRRFIDNGEVLSRMIARRLRRVPEQEGWYRIPIESRDTNPERFERVAAVLEKQAAKTRAAYDALVRRARQKLDG
jgi:hypothetical protein